jgi:phospholipase C
MPATASTAARPASLPRSTTPATPRTLTPPVQAQGVRPSRALPYALEATIAVDERAARFVVANTGRAGAVFHVYDGLDSVHAPRRYTVAPGERMLDAVALQAGRYDLWILGPNGFHRHFRGTAEPTVAVAAAFDPKAVKLTLSVRNTGGEPLDVNAMGNAYAMKTWRAPVPPGQTLANAWPLAGSAGWYDLSVTVLGHPGWLRRYAGRLETGRHSTSDPAMHGPALMTREA